jgi:hypothetical protein
VANMPLLCFSIMRKPTIPPGNTVYFRTLKVQAFGADCQHSSLTSWPIGKFRVKSGPNLSDTYKQEIGVPQGIILSVTLFVLKINSIVKCLPLGFRGSLFVDDFLICYR